MIDSWVSNLAQGAPWISSAPRREERCAAQHPGTCVIRFTREAHPGVFDARRWPALVAHAERCEGLPPFQEIAQPFSAPGE